MKQRDCTCAICVGACKTRPGWFAPGEVEKAAALMGMEVEAFKRKFVIREYWVGAEGDIYCYSPRMVGVDVGRKTASFASAWQGRPCVFLDENDRCRIHAAKPKECRDVMCCDPSKKALEASEKSKAEIVEAWRLIGGAR